MNKKNISAVVINYNGKENLRKCLTELLKHKELFEIIVVDDGSDDGSSELAKQHFKNVVLIANKINKGPVFSREVGYKKSQGEYIYFVDSDIVIKKNTIETLLNFLQTNKDYWLVGSKLYEENGTDTLWNYGHFPNLWKNFVLMTSKKDKYSIIPDNKRVDWVAEASFLVKKEIMDKIGGFDTNFFMYHEAPDISLTAVKKGYLSAIEPKSVATHMSQKTKLKGKDRFLVFQESTRYFYKKHYNRLSYIGIWILTALYIGVRKLGLKNKTHYE